MTYNEKLITIRAMKAYGGSFVVALAEAFLRADEHNEQRIESAFPDYMLKYGPGSDMFSATEKEEA
jgi:hypothetical protein